MDGARITFSCLEACDICPSLHFEIPGDERTPLELVTVAMGGETLEDLQPEVDELSGFAQGIGGGIIGDLTQLQIPPEPYPAAIGVFRTRF